MKLLIVPFLHERKIYLQRLKFNTEYFQTLIETNTKDTPMNNSLSSKYCKSAKDITSTIVSMNLTESKYHIYSVSGLMIGSVNF